MEWLLETVSAINGNENTRRLEPIFQHMQEANILFGAEALIKSQSNACLKKCYTGRRSFTSRRPINLKK